MAPAVFFKTIGCKTNQQECATLQSLCAAENARVVRNAEDADIVILNTCTVTASAEAKSRRAIRHIHRLAPHARICVTGCWAQHTPDTIEKMDGVTWVFGNSAKKEIPRLMNEKFAMEKVRWKPTESWQAQEIFFDGISASSVFPSRSRFPIKIQQGCDNHCAYCIVPAVRGPSRIRDSEEILEHCRTAVANGYKELVVTGTHIGLYHDRTHGIGDLVELLEAIARLPGDFRIRLSSLNPSELDERLIDMICTDEKICRHLHISMQSMSPDVIRAMQRDPDDMLQCVERLSSLVRARSDIRIGTDIIAGFPTETEAAFVKTCCNFEYAGFNYAHVFRFSSRPETAAAQMRPCVSDAEITRRASRLREMAAVQAGRFFQARKGEIMRTILEKQSPLRCMSDNYIRIRITQPESGTIERNSWCNVQVEGVDDNGHCVGSIVDKDM